MKTILEFTQEDVIGIAKQNNKSIDEIQHIFKARIGHHILEYSDVSVMSHKGTWVVAMSFDLTVDVDKMNTELVNYGLKFI